MKILHWDEMFHPSFGYQINVLSKYQALKGHEVIIMTSENINNHPTFKSFGNEENILEGDKKFTEKYGVKIIRLPIFTVISGRVIYKPGFLQKILDLNPDVIMCHTNDTLSSMIITKNYKYINKPIVFDNHMLKMASKNPFSNLFRWYFKKRITPIIINNELTVIKTQNDDYVNSCLGIPESLTPFISFGSDKTIFHPNSKIKTEIRNKYNLSPEDFVIIYTGKLTEEKGGMLLGEVFLTKFPTDKRVVLFVIGNSFGDYGRKVEDLFSKSENVIIRIPTQKYTDLPSYYQASDLCVFPKQASLSFYDAQACGLPVISENNNVNIDRLQRNNGLNFISGDAVDFRDKITKVLNMEKSKFQEMSNAAIKYIEEEYDYSIIEEKYTDVLRREINRFNSIKK